MKVAVDARPLCVPTFGIGRYLHSLMQRLVSEDIEWFLYADRPLVATFDEPNVTCRSFASTNHLLSLYRSQIAFAQMAVRDEVDVFWSPRHHLPLSLPKRIPSVLTIHDLVWKRFPETMLGRNRLVERVLMPRSLEKATEIIAVSRATRDDICLDYPDVASKITVVHEAADAVSVEPATRATPYFVFLGTLEPRKNLERLIEAFAAAKKDLPAGCRLLILGAQGWKTSPAAAIDRLGVAGDVDVLGYVDEKTLHETLAGAIALCLPSLYEGFGLPALEAMQHGTPVIGSNVSSIPEVVGAGGLLVDPLSVGDVSQAMMRIASDPELRAALSTDAVTQAGKFSWETAAAETLVVLERAASLRR